MRYHFFFIVNLLIINFFIGASSGTTPYVELTASSGSSGTASARIGAVAADSALTLQPQRDKFCNNNKITFGVMVTMLTGYSIAAIPDLIKSQHIERSRPPAFVWPSLPKPAGKVSRCFDVQLERTFHDDERSGRIPFAPLCSPFNISNLATVACNPRRPIDIREWDPRACQKREKPFSCWTDEQIAEIFPKVCKAYVEQTEGVSSFAKPLSKDALSARLQKRIKKHADARS